jgi:phage gp46-like protein
MTDIYQGDPALVLGVNGSKLVFKGGQPVMDQGLENLALISLFTTQGWVGNSLFADPAQRIGSDFMDAANQPITLSMLNDVAQAAKRALDDPAFGNVIVNVENPNSYRLNVTIRLEPPGQDSMELLLEKNGLNWIFQKLKPAHERI